MATPPEATAAEVAALVAACDRAYHDGGCQEMGAAPTGEVVAEVRWHSDTEATVSLGIRHWKPNRWIRRNLHFEALDVPTERYKSLGFALGGLAGTVIEVAGLEAEARSAPSKVDAPKAVPNERSADGERPKKAESPKGRTRAEDAERDERGELILPVPTASRGRLPPSSASSSSTAVWVPIQFFIGAAAGSGLGRLQIGGVIAVGAALSRGWFVEGSGRYSAHSANGRGVAGEYVGLQLSLGHAFDLQPIQLGVKVGPLVHWFTSSFSASGDAKSGREQFGVLAGAQLAVSSWWISPYLGVDAGYREITDVTVDDVRVDSFGPWILQSSLGLRFDGNLL